MNKYIIKALFCAALAAPVFTSCDLDLNPADSIPSEESWQTMSDAENHYVGMLSVIRSVSSACASTMEVQTDLFNQTGGSSAYYQIHDWSFTPTQFEGDVLWSGNYNLIANANDFINNVGHISVEAGSANEKTLKYYTGVAYFARAYAYSTLAMRYCKNYDEATAESTLGLPLVTVVDVTAKPSRSSLAATYQLIREDITKAKELMADEQNLDYTAPHYNTALALEARVCLDMKDYDQAIKSADEALKHYKLFTKKNDFQTMWTSDMADEGTELIFEPQYTQDERASLWGAFISHSYSISAFTPNYVPTQKLYDMYTRSDFRQSVYFTRGTINSGSVTTTGRYLSKFPGNTALNKSTDQYSYYNMPKPFRTAELYLIAAEASCEKDGTGASYLSALRQARGLSATSATGAELLQSIKDEWVREFAGEGFRLNCLKRWHEGFTRGEAQSLPAGFLRTANGVQGLTVDADNYRFIWEIPSNDLQANKNLQRNWPNE